jgi:IS4 transposase
MAGSETPPIESGENTDSFTLNPGSIVAMDRGYTDYALFGRWTIAGVFFVTRLKDNAAFAIEAEFKTPENRNIRADQIVRLTGVQAQTDCPGSLRRLVVWDADNQREIVLLTNLFDFGATTIAAIYKERWQIELFFKALKQNLTVKTFVGTSENALRIQIWTALIALLLLKWLHHLSKANWSLSNLASLLRLNLFTYRELTHWMDNPMGTPPLIPAAEQLTLALV